jgi:hypothetical protein
MKLFIVTCLKEYQDDVIKIFRKANIEAFSVTPVVGYKDNSPVTLLENWFASGDEQFDSLMIFSFTGVENVEYGMNEIEAFNRETKTKFPVHAFVVPVEESTR